MRSGFVLPHFDAREPLALKTRSDYLQRLLSLVAQRTHVSRLVKPADASVGAALELYLASPEAECSVISCSIMTSADVSENVTNYAVFLLSRADGAGGALTTLGRMTTETTGFTKGKVRAIPELGDVVVARDAAIVLNITKSGSGLSLPLLTIELRYRLSQ